MTVLIFTHGDYEVATAAWTISAKPGNGVRICYAWGANGYSFSSGATGVASRNFATDISTFLRLIGNKYVVDLRNIA
jgi:hypothetical protein